MTISQAAEVVEWNSICGPWKFLRLEEYMTPISELPLSEEEMKSSKGPGDYLVGVHIYPGIWRVNGSKHCEWTVFDITSDSIQHKTGSSGTINLRPPAYWVRISKDCFGVIFLQK